MANFNKVILAGNLTRDPEMRYTPKGHPYARFGLAVHRSWKNEAGETKEEVTFVDLLAWARQAELICQYLKKGNPLLVEGRLRYETWEDKQTSQKRSKLVVVIESFQFVGPARSESGGTVSRPISAPAAAVPATAAVPESAESAEPDAPETEREDVPF
jgi:single-strand DNA-binding protein